MKATVILWTSIALVGGLVTGYVVGSSGLAILNRDFEANIRSREAKVAQLEAERTKLRSVLERVNKEISEFQIRAEEGKIMRAAMEKSLAAKTAALQASLHRVSDESLLSASKLAMIANSFHDIQHEVAAGKFEGLSLTNGYQRLKEQLDNPEIVRFLADYDSVVGK